MTCQEFDQIWNELLDAETAASQMSARGDDAFQSARAAREEAARSHARNCPRCRHAGARNELLRRALRSWTPGALASVDSDLVDRIVISARPSPGRSVRRVCATILLATTSLAAAAVLLLMVAPVQWRLDPPAAGRAADRPLAAGGGEPVVPRADARRLSNALVSATEATWDLARTTSEPAARLGRQVIEAATQTEGSADPTSAPGSPLVAFPSVFQDLPQSTTGAAWLQDMGDGLAASVRPLSTTARQAFGFLRTPLLGKAGNPINPPASKGA
jgi:hypothetical protein